MLSTCVAVAAAAFTGAAASQPSAPLAGRPVRLVVPFPAGGPVDVIARTVADVAQSSLGQSLLIENRPGAAGMLGTDSVARAQPDGHTLVMGSSSTHSLAGLSGARPPYDPVQSFRAVILIGQSPAILVAHPKQGEGGMQGLIRRLRQRPGQMSFGSSGSGSFNHLLMEDFKRATGTYIVHVPYRGTGQAMTDLAGGQIDLMFDSVVTALPQIRAGRIAGLATTSPQRLPMAPELPTLAETVAPGFEASLYLGIFAPAGTPPALVTSLNKAFAIALESPALRDRLLAAGILPGGGPPERLQSLVASESGRWRRLIAERSLQLKD